MTDAACVSAPLAQVVAVLAEAGDKSTLGKNGGFGQTGDDAFEEGCDLQYGRRGKMFFGLRV
jgi:hypothetical protein